MHSRLIKFIGYDIRNGLLRKWTVFLVTAIASLIAIEQTDITIKEGATGTDYILGIFSGMSRFYISPDAVFNIPFLWFVFMIIPAFLIGDYAVGDLNAYGIQLIVKSRSKLSWWISKTIWCLISVITYFIVIFAVIGGYALATGRPLVGDSRNWCEYAGVYTSVDIGELVLHGIVVPALTIFTLCMMQMLFSLIFGALTAYVIIIVYDILAAYITYPVFIGNYSMLLRDRAYVYDGLDYSQGMIIELTLLVLTFITGMFIMKKTALFKYSRNMVE